MNTFFSVLHFVLGVALLIAIIIFNNKKNKLEKELKVANSKNQLLEKITDFDSNFWSVDHLLQEVPMAVVVSLRAKILEYYILKIRHFKLREMHQFLTKIDEVHYPEKKEILLEIFSEALTLTPPDHLGFICAQAIIRSVKEPTVLTWGDCDNLNGLIVKSIFVKRAGESEDKEEERLNLFFTTLEGEAQDIFEDKNIGDGEKKLIMSKCLKLQVIDR
jgi:hypothetical protein